MRTTLNLSEDAFLTAQSHARRLKISLGEAVSRLIRDATLPHAARSTTAAPLRGRFALAPMRDEVITVEHVRELMEREGI